MMVKWAEEFNKTYPQVRIDVSAGGAGKGAADALAGLTDIGMVSREVKPEETKQGGFHVAVVKDAVFPTMNAENPAAKEIMEKTGIRKDTFLDLWIRGKSPTWGEVAGGKHSGGAVQVYTRSDSCGGRRNLGGLTSEERTRKI